MRAGSGIGGKMPPRSRVRHFLFRFTFLYGLVHAPGPLRLILIQILFVSAGRGHLRVVPLPVDGHAMLAMTNYFKESIYFPSYA